MSKDGIPAFRSYFSQVGDLRAVFPQVPMLCLTATASESTMEKIKNLLNLRNPDIYRGFAAAFGPNSSNLSERLYDMVHSKTPNNIKEFVTKSLMDPNSRLRVVIATKVIGMGIDIQCQQVIHFGPPQTVDDYVQQIGRAGRDGSQSHAILLYSAMQLRNVDSSMIRLLKSEKCFRELMLEPFKE